MKKLLYLFGIIGLLSCEINQRNVKPKNEFSKIFHYADERISFFPAGICETNDDGYLYISARKSDTAIVEYPQTILVKLDEAGVLVWSVESEWYSPIACFELSDGSFAYIAADAAQNSWLIRVDPSTGKETGSEELDITMPLAAKVLKNGNLVVLGYDYINRLSVVSMYSIKEGVSNLAKAHMPVNTDEIGLVLEHLNKSGQESPFFIGEWGDDNHVGVFVNCLANYTLRLVFLDSALKPTGGDVYSFQTRDAISSMCYKVGGAYLFTRYYGNNNYISPHTFVDSAKSQNFNELRLNIMPEFPPKAKVKVEKSLMNEGEYIFLASSTNSNSLIIQQYSLVGEELLHTEIRSFAEDVEVADILVDKNDDSLVVLGRVFVNGKFPRPLVIKVPGKNFR